MVILPGDTGSSCSSLPVSVLWKRRGSGVVSKTNSEVERYRSPPSGSRATTVPFPNAWASSRATFMAAPALIPTKIPSSRQPSGHRIGRIVIHADDRAQLIRLEDPGRVALLHVLQALDLVALEGLDADDADCGVEFPQRTGCAHQRARGPHRDHHDIHLAAGGFPNLLARALIVSLPVGLVVELVDQDILSRLFPGQAVGLFDGPVGAAVARREEDLRP